MKELSRDAFISFLYSERDRLFSQHSFAGWNVWVIVGALFGMVWLIIDLIAEKTFQAVPFIGFSITFLLVGFFILMSLKQKMIKETTPFKNRYNIVGVNNISLLNTLTLIGISFLLLHYGFWHSSKIVVALTLFITIINIIGVIFAYINRGIPVLAGTKKVEYTKHKKKSYVFAILFYAFVVYLLYDLSGAYLFDFRSYVDEIKLSISIVSFYFLIRILIILCSKSDLLSQVEVIMDEFIYGNLSQQETYNRLTICQYGLSLEQVVQKELNEYLTNKGELERHVGIIKEAISQFKNNRPTEIQSRIKFITDALTPLKQEMEIVQRFQTSQTNLFAKIKNISIPIEEKETLNNLIKILDDGNQRTKCGIELVEKLLLDAQEELTNLVSTILNEQENGQIL